MKIFTIVFLLIVQSLFLVAQDEFQFSTSHDKSSIMDVQFTDYHVVQNQAVDFINFLNNRSQTDEFTLKIADLEISMVLYPYDIRSEDYKAIIQTENGTYIAEKTEVITYRGYVNDKNKGSVRMTLNDGFIYGFVDTEKETYYFEPSRYYTQNPADKTTVIYANQSLINPKEASCGGNHDHTTTNVQVEDQATKSTSGQCFINNLGIVTDYSMFIDPNHNSIDQLINHTLGVTNNTSTNFELNGTNNFDNGLDLYVRQHYISTCSSCDPWSDQLDFAAFLEEFSVWSQSSGFSDDIDMGQMWTDRNFNGPAVGLASVSNNLLCDKAAFHVIQDWTTNAPILRVMTAHEMAHNLNCQHDSSNGFIMSPVVSNTSTWSNNSKLSVGTQIAQQGVACLTSCQPVLCECLTNVSIDQVTTSNFSLSWDATAASSYGVIVFDAETKTELVNMTTNTNSVVLSPQDYAICKQYEVLLSNNCGANMTSCVEHIRMTAPTAQGCASFESEVKVAHSGFPIAFLDESLNANSWLWDFGDGNTSTLRNPQHIYANAGDYNVSLTVNGGIHTQVKNSFIKILPTLPTPYTLADGGDFETNTDHFAAFKLQGDDVLIEHGVAGNKLTSNSNVWKTKLNEDIGRREADVVLVSPKFDFAQPGVYILHFDMSMETIFCNGPAGLRMEYSTDSGQTWVRLGSYGDSGPDIVGWYDRGPTDFCPLASQVFPDQTGWSFDGTDQNKSYDVSFLAGNSGVIFRYRYKVSSIFSSGYEIDGFSIDNFEITALKSALPLDLISFDAEIKNGAIALNWQTANEYSMEGFLIERATVYEDFEAIGEKEAYNDIENSYAHLDNHPHDGTNFYRLKMINVDGSYRYSDIISVDIDNTGSDARLVIFPNPISDELLKVNLNNESIGNMKVYDMTGREHAVKRSDNDTLDLSGLNTGIYVLAVTSKGGKRLTTKFSKI